MPALAPGQTAIDRTILPPLGDPPDVTFPPVQRAKLANGMNVVLVERHATPLVNLSLAVDAGFASDSPEKAGAASLALDLLDDGTTPRTRPHSGRWTALRANKTVARSTLFVRLNGSRATSSASTCSPTWCSTSFRTMVELAKSAGLAQIDRKGEPPYGGDAIVRTALRSGTLRCTVDRVDLTTVSSSARRRQVAPGLVPPGGRDAHRDRRHDGARC